MKVWAVTLDVSTLNNTAFESVRVVIGTLIYLWSFDLTLLMLFSFYLVLRPGIAVCG